MNFFQNIFQSFEEKVANINDPKELAKLWEKKSESSKERAIVEVRLSEVLSKIDDHKTLHDLNLSNRKNIGICILVDQRMAEVFAKILPQIEDIKILGEFTTMTLVNGKASMVLDERVTEVISKILPQMDDPTEILLLQNEFSKNNDISIKLIEDRASTVIYKDLSRYDDLEEVENAWKDMPDHPVFLKAAQERAEEILSPILCQINLEDLLNYWRKITPSLINVEIIDKKAIELILDLIAKREMASSGLSVAEFATHYNNTPVFTKASYMLASHIFEEAIRTQKPEILQSCIELLSHHSEDHKKMICQAFEKVVNSINSSEGFISIGEFAQATCSPEIAQYVIAFIDLNVMDRDLDLHY